MHWPPPQANNLSRPWCGTLRTSTKQQSSSGIAIRVVLFLSTRTVRVEASAAIVYDDFFVFLDRRKITGHSERICGSATTPVQDPALVVIVVYFAPCSHVLGLRRARSYGLRRPPDPSSRAVRVVTTRLNASVHGQAARNRPRSGCALPTTFDWKSHFFFRSFPRSIFKSITVGRESRASAITTVRGYVRAGYTDIITRPGYRTTTPGGGSVPPFSIRKFFLPHSPRKTHAEDCISNQNRCSQTNKQPNRSTNIKTRFKWDYSFENNRLANYRHKTVDARVDRKIRPNLREQ